jgi:hypothetical protein
VPAARRSSCTSPRRQGAGAHRSRHVGRDNPWRAQCGLPRLAAAGARCAQHAAGNFDNRHVEIVCPASAHVNVSVLYQFVDSAKPRWPTSVAPRRLLLRSGSAWLGRSQKDGLPSCRGVNATAVQGHQLAHRGGAAWSLPLLIGGGNGRQVARPRFALLPVAVLRSLRLGGGSRSFWLDLFCARCSRHSRRSLWAATLTAATQKGKSPAKRAEHGLRQGVVSLAPLVVQLS